MRGLRGAAVALGAACFATVATGFIGAGCGSSNTTSGSTSDSGSADSTADSTQPEQDSSATDSSQDISTMTDSSAPTDSSTSPIDSSTAPTDSASDVADSGSAGDSADAADAGNPVLAFAMAEATAICEHFQPCCPALPADAGMAYSLTDCIASYRGYGWEGNLPYDQNALIRGKLTVNEIQAAECLAAINSTNLPCPQQTAAGWSAVTNACEGVLQGVIGIGQTGCVSSFECVPGSYCNPAVPGTCTALATQGQPCNTVINTPDEPIPDEMCSYLGSSSNGMFCDLIDPSTSPKYATCQPLLAAGATCVNATTQWYDDQACPASGALCGDNNECGGTASYPYAGSGECYYTASTRDQ
jgi:hypothetical protein